MLELNFNKKIPNSNRKRFGIWDLKIGISIQ